MAALSGKAAKVEYGGGKVVGLRDWSLDVDTNMLDVTTWSTGTDQWRSFAAGLSGGSGSLGGFADQASTGQDDLITNTLTPTTAQLILYIDRSGGANFRGSVFLNRMSYGADIDGTVDAGWDFTYTGAVTYSTAT